MGSQPLNAKVTQWEGPGPSTEAVIEHKLASEGLSAYRWSNGPGDRYAAHTHTYD